MQSDDTQSIIYNSYQVKDTDNLILERQGQSISSSSVAAESDKNSVAAIEERRKNFAVL
jgi:hypothetical protein